MKFKKGFIRLIILGLIISPVIAYFQTSDELRQVKINFIETTQKVYSSISNPECVALLNADNGINAGDAGFNCVLLKIYWKDIKVLQGPPTDFQGIKDVMAKEERISKLEVYLPAMFKVFGLYLLFWASGFALFFIGRWIIKGFKSQ